MAEARAELARLCRGRDGGAGRASPRLFDSAITLDGMFRAVESPDLPAPRMAAHRGLGRIAAGRRGAGRAGDGTEFRWIDEVIS